MEKFFWLMVVLALFFLPGCARKVDLGPGYEKTSKNFLQALRWQDFEGAAGSMQAGERQKFLATFSEMKDLHIVEAEYRYSRLNKELGTAESELVLKYYLLPSTRVKDWVWKIDWLLIPVDTTQRGTWLVQGGVPAFP